MKTHPEILPVSAACLLLATSLSTFPATLTVTTTANTGAGSLRQAIADAAPDDIINFSVTGSIALTSGRLILGKNVIIEGPGATNLAVSGNNQSILFDVSAGVTGSISGLTLVHGRQSATAGGAIFNRGNLDVSRCQIRQCSADSGAGAIYNQSGASLVVTECSMNGNNAGIGGGAPGGAIFNAGFCFITNSTFFGNVSRNAGGGLFNQGGTLVVSSCTIASNTTGFCDQFGCAGRGGGIRNETGSTTLHNSIVAGNSSFSSAPDCSGTINGGDFNLVANPSGSSLSGTHNITGQDALLGPPQINGGTTLTLALLGGSPAVNEGDSGNFPPTDQRGVVRPQAGVCDIGAYESETACPNIMLSPASLPAGVAGAAYSQLFAASIGTAPYTFVFRGGTLPPGLALAPDGTLSGTPTSPGTFDFTVMATDSTGCQGFGNYALGIGTLADLSLALADAPDPVPSGSNVTYTLTVSNAGPSSAAGVMLTDTLDGEALFVSASSSQGMCRHENGVVTCDLGTIARGESATVTVIAATAAPGQIANSAEAHGGNPDPVTANNQAGVSTIVTGGARFVVNHNDSGPGSLRDALARSAPGGTIGFHIAGTITLTSGPLLLTRPIDIRGPGATNLTLHGQRTYRHFTVDAGVTASIRDLTLAGGYGQFDAGGAIYNRGTTTVQNCFITGCSGDSGGGGIYSDFTSALVVDQCAFNGNDTGQGFGGAPGGAIFNRGACAISNSTFFGNSSRHAGGAIFNQGGALILASSTVASNQTGFCDAFGCAGVGGGVTVESGPATILNTIIAGNTTRANAADCAGTILAGDYNLVLNPAGASFSGAHNIFGQDPQLGPFQDNGGPTPTMEPHVGSPALSSADPGNFPVTDQRGVLRPKGSGPDIGAWEGPPCPVVTLAPDPLPDGTNGFAYAHLFAAGGGVPPYNFALTAGALPSGLFLSPSGVLTGNPLASGAFDFTVTARDTNGCDASRAFTLVIRDSADLAVLWLPLPPLPVTSGSNVTLTLIVTNRGVSPATQVRLTNSLPEAALLVSVSLTAGSCQVTGGVVTCDVGGLAPNASAVLTVTLKTIGPGLLSISAYASADESDPDLANNSASQMIAVTGTNRFVINTADTGVGSLRRALQNYASGDTILFCVTGTVSLATGELSVPTDLTIAGPGASILSISGGNGGRIFNVASAARLTVSDLTLTQGSDVPDRTGGGAVRNAGILRLDRCLLLGNRADQVGSALYTAAAASTTLNGCSFVSNTVTVAGLRGGAVANEGSLAMTNCTVTGNQSPGNAGGIYSAGSLTIHSSTICSNQAMLGGGCYLASGAARVSNTMIAGNRTPSGNGADCFGVVTAGDYNCLQSTGGSAFTGTHNVTGQDPRLGPLSLNGGPTPNHTLLTGSPALDKGLGSGLTTDQRLRPRPIDNPNINRAAGGDHGDIGAVEKGIFIISVIKVGADMRVSFGTDAGQNHRLERTDSLSSGMWTTVANNIPGTGGVVTVIDAGAASRPGAFYRVEALP